MLSLPVVALCFMPLPGMALPGMASPGLSNGRSVSTTVGAGDPAAPPTVADVCLTDGQTHDTLLFSSSTGAYTFTRCKDGFTLSGTGTVRKSGSVIVLSDKKSDRMINANFLSNQKTGKATVVLILSRGVFQTILISQTNPSSVCGCAT
jgi:hypothetical protein